MPSSPEDILRRDREAADRFAVRAGKDGLRASLEKAQGDLEARLERVKTIGAGDDSFSAAQVKATLEQVRSVLRPLQGDVQRVAVGYGLDAAEEQTGATVRYLRVADRHFRGIGQGLQLDEAALYEQAVSGTKTSILSRIAGDPAHPARPGVLARYGTAVIGHFELELQQRFLARTPWEDVKQGLVAGSPFLQGAPAHWAERIVRTEVMHANNRSAWETMRAADEQLGDACKILSCAFDDRTGADSIAVHGQIRKTEEAFDSWFGSFQHPPDRPNDRAVVVPHRVSWPIPAYLEPRSEGEVLSRWHLEGRKGSPPGRPLMSTIDRALFGKSPAPKVDEQAPAPEEEVAPPPAEPTVTKPAIDKTWIRPAGIVAEPNTDVVDERPGAFQLRDAPGFAEDVWTDDPNQFGAVRRGAFAKLANAAEVGRGRVDSAALLPGFTQATIPPDYKSRIDEALRESARVVDKKKLSMKKAVAELGNVRQFGPSQLAKVKIPSTLERNLVARHIASNPNSAEPTNAKEAAIPLIVKHKGEYFVHEGAERFAAQLALNDADTYFRARVLDIDKLATKPVEPQAWAKRAKAMKVIGSGYPNLDEERATRESLREVLLGHGIATRDDMRIGRWIDPKTLATNDGGDRIESVPQRKIAGANGTHAWDGRVRIEHSVMREATKKIEELEKNPGKFASKNPEDKAYRDEGGSGLRVLIHEELHGASSANPSAYQANGVGIEEALTEIAARKVTRELLGGHVIGDDARAVPFPLPDYADDLGFIGSAPVYGTYDYYIQEVIKQTHEATGVKKGVAKMVEEATMKTRRWEGGARVWNNAAEQIDAFVDALDIKDKKKADVLRTKLKATSSLKPLP